MASTQASAGSSSVRRERVVVEPQRPKPPRSGLTSFWKALIITSFAVNIILIALVLTLVGFVVQWRNQVVGTTVGVQGFARNNVAELRSVVQGLQDATIRQEIPLDTVTIPVQLNVPVDQETVVTTIDPVPLQVENADIDLGLAGRLRANVNLTLPAGTPLKIRLNMTIPIEQPLPLEGKNVTVPVNIPLKDTELGPQFRRLGELVDRLAGPAAPLLGLDIPPAPPAPPAPTAVPSEP
jgi:hypothetical protein